MGMLISRIIRWAGHVARMGQIIRYAVFVAKAERTNPHGILWSRPEDKLNANEECVAV
jgi:hypothetical protein